VQSSRLLCCVSIPTRKKVPVPLMAQLPVHFC
jgi:hypothetical protein